MIPATESPDELRVLVEVYHRYGAERRDADFWAWDRVGDIVRGPDPKRALDLAWLLVATAPEAGLQALGAHALEELVTYHGPALVDRLESEAATDPRFRAALASVWLVAEEVPPRVLERLQVVTGHRIRVATKAELREAESALRLENPDEREA